VADEGDTPQFTQIPLVSLGIGPKNNVFGPISVSLGASAG
jgi:hypothetical protein